MGEEKRQEEDATNQIESSNTIDSISLEGEDTLVSGSGLDSVDSVDACYPIRSIVNQHEKWSNM